MKNTLDSRGARVHPGTMLAPDPHALDDLRALGFGAVRGGGNGKGFEVTSELSPEVHLVEGRVQRELRKIPQRSGRRMFACPLVLEISILCGLLNH